MISSEEYTMRVHTTAQRLVDSIVDETKDMDPGSRWLFFGRVINSVFRHHFEIGLNFSENRLIEAEAKAASEKDSKP